MLRPQLGGDELGGLALELAILHVVVGGRLLLARPADGCEDCGTNDEAGRSSQGSGHRGLGCGFGWEGLEQFIQFSQRGDIVAMHGETDQTPPATTMVVKQ